jgi:hypothetical protein
MGTYRFIGLVVSVTAAILTGCGGGSSGGGTDAAPVALADPQLAVYGTFDLSKSAQNRVLSSTCQSPSSQLNLQQAYSRSNGTFGFYNFIVDGSFVLPNGPGSCSISGITGVITGAAMQVDNSAVYQLTSLGIAANSIQSDYKQFWRAVLAQTGKIMVPKTSNAIITCTDSLNVQQTLALTSTGDAATFINSCLQ